jgi:putative NADPH-quinone reductase
MNNLIIISHPNTESFCYNGIYKTIHTTLKEAGESIRVIDLYSDDFNSSKRDLVKSY